jgi:acyl-CoA synthetase (AMP-forming)/AMP-acid ligase II
MDEFWRRSGGHERVGPFQSFTVLGLLPMYHVFGMLVVLHGALFSGATLVTLPKFEPESFLHTMHAHQITYAHLVPPLVNFLAKHPSVEVRRTLVSNASDPPSRTPATQLSQHRHAWVTCAVWPRPSAPLAQPAKLSALKVINSGAAPLDSGLAKATADKVGCEVMQGYGMTELSPVGLVGDYRNPGSVGVLLPSTEARLVRRGPEDETVAPANEDCDVGEAGELWIRGPQVRALRALPLTLPPLPYKRLSSISQANDAAPPPTPPSMAVA